MSSIPPIPNAVSSDLRIMGIPVNGLPDAVNNTLQWDSINNLFVWVPQSSSDMGNKVSVEHDNFQGGTVAHGNSVIEGDANSKKIVIASQTMGVNPTLSVINAFTGTPLVGGLFGTVFSLQIFATAQITLLEIWLSDTVDTADGTKFYDSLQVIIINGRLTLTGILPNGKFLTVKATGNVSIQPDTSTALELSE